MLRSTEPEERVWLCGGDEGMTDTSTSQENRKTKDNNKVRRGRLQNNGRRKERKNQVKTLPKRN